MLQASLSRNVHAENSQMFALVCNLGKTLIKPKVSFCFMNGESSVAPFRQFMSPLTEPSHMTPKYLENILNAFTTIQGLKDY